MEDLSLLTMCLTLTSWWLTRKTARLIELTFSITLRLGPVLDPNDNPKAQLCN